MFWRTESVSQLSDVVNPDGEGQAIALLGGHYQWPGYPSDIAIRTARTIIELVDSIGANRTQPFLFLNDVAVSCSPGGQCSLHSRHLPELPNSFEQWFSQHGRMLEESLNMRSLEVFDFIRSIQQLVATHN